MEEKMQVLAKIARVLNQKKVVWSVGGSMLLYFKGITETVQDIDLLWAVSSPQIQMLNIKPGVSWNLSSMGLMWILWRDL